MKLWLKTITVAVATSLWLSFAASAGPLSFDFSFTFTGPAETVMGVITGLSDNTTSAATSVQVTSNTADFGIGEYVGAPQFNSFTATAGMVTSYEFEDFGADNTSPAVTCCSLGFGSAGTFHPRVPLAGLTNDPTTIAFLGGSVIFTPAISVPGPIAGAGLPGLLLAGLGWLGWRRRARPQLADNC